MISNYTEFGSKCNHDGSKKTTTKSTQITKKATYSINYKTYASESKVGGDKHAGPLVLPVFFTVLLKTV